MIKKIIDEGSLKCYLCVHVYVV